MIVKVLPLLAALLAGSALATQGVINSQLSRYVGQIRAVSISLLVSVVTVLVVLAVYHKGGAYSGLAAAPRWTLVGGTLGVVVLIGSIIAVPRLGAATTTGLIVMAQLMAAAVIDQFGLLGVATRHLTAGRSAGLALLVVAVILIVRS